MNSGAGTLRVWRKNGSRAGRLLFSGNAMRHSQAATAARTFIRHVDDSVDAAKRQTRAEPEKERTKARMMHVRGR